MTKRHEQYKRMASTLGRWLENERNWDHIREDGPNDTMAEAGRDGEWVAIMVEQDPGHEPLVSLYLGQEAGFSGALELTVDLESQFDGQYPTPKQVLALMREHRSGLVAQVDERNRAAQMTKEELWQRVGKALDEYHGVDPDDGYTAARDHIERALELVGLAQYELDEGMHRVGGAYKHGLRDGWERLEEMAVDLGTVQAAIAGKPVLLLESWQHGTWKELSVTTKGDFVNHNDGLADWVHAQVRELVLGESVEFNLGAHGRFRVTFTGTGYDDIH